MKEIEILKRFYTLYSEMEHNVKEIGTKNSYYVTDREKDKTDCINKIALELNLNSATVRECINKAGRKLENKEITAEDLDLEEYVPEKEIKVPIKMPYKYDYYPGEHCGQLWMIGDVAQGTRIGMDSLGLFQLYGLDYENNWECFWQV